jgi:quercetin dioxygenase-like cupin family protein
VNFFKLGDYDVSAIHKEVMGTYADFDVDTRRQNEVAYHAQTKSYRLTQGVLGGAKDIFHTEGIEKTNFYDARPKCVEFLNEFTKAYGGDIARVSLVLLPSGADVTPHRDAGTYYEGKDRFHLVISGSYMVQVGTDVQRFSQGELWFFANKQVHSTRNNGQVERIAMIFDVDGSTWREVCNAI